MVENIKKYFPIFESHPGLVYLDNAATTQRHVDVIKAVCDFQTSGNANIHRGVYDLSNNATRDFENVRAVTARFLGIPNSDTIAFTTGTTQGINIVANSFLYHRLNSGDNIVTTIMEHHANLIPWQHIAHRKGAELRISAIDEDGNLDVNDLRTKLDKRTGILAITHISNTLGTINQIGKIIEMAHELKIPVLVDAAQSAAYYDLIASDLHYDFLVFSGHKIFGPFGTGILYAREKWHDEIRPYELGGGIVYEVTTHGTTFQKFPRHLDAGTPNISGIIGLGKSIEFLARLDKGAARAHLHKLTAYARDELSKISDVHIIGSPVAQSGIVSFTVDRVHPHDVASFLNQDKIAVRAGLHCTQPLLRSLNVDATVRASFSIYNDTGDIDKLAESLKSMIKIWV